MPVKFNALYFPDRQSRKLHDGNPAGKGIAHSLHQFRFAGTRQNKLPSFLRIIDNPFDFFENTVHLLNFANKQRKRMIQKKSLGSSFACSLVNRSSKSVLLSSGNTCLITADFPTCLAPISRRHLLVAALFFKYGETALSKYGIQVPPPIIYKLLLHYI